MSQNPYAQPYPQQYQQPPGYGMQAPPRTSALAILSLVCSLLCCIPGPSILGVLFGGVALLAIGMSGGRVKGVGLAISGLIIGIVVTVIWIAMAIGAMGLGTMFGKMVDPALKGLAARDVTQTQSAFVSSAHGSIDRGRVQEFGRLVEDTYGQYERMPEGIGELIGEWGTIFSDPNVGQATQTAQNQFGQDGVFPMPAKFDTGWHAIMIYMDSSGSQTNQTSGMPLLHDIGIVLDDGSLVWLVSDAGSPLPSLDDLRRNLNIPGLNGRDDGGDNGGDEGGDPLEEPAPRRTRSRP